MFEQRCPNDRYLIRKRPLANDVTNGRFWPKAAFRRHRKGVRLCDIAKCPALDLRWNVLIPEGQLDVVEPSQPDLRIGITQVHLPFGGYAIVGRRPLGLLRHCSRPPADGQDWYEY